MEVGKQKSQRWLNESAKDVIDRVSSSGQELIAYKWIAEWPELEALNEDCIAMWGELQRVEIYQMDITIGTDLLTSAQYNIAKMP